MKFALTPEQSTDTLLWWATSPEAAKLKGEYLTKREVIQLAKQGLDV